MALRSGAAGALGSISSCRLGGCADGARRVVAGVRRVPVGRAAAGVDARVAGVRWAHRARMKKWSFAQKQKKRRALRVVNEWHDSNDPALLAKNLRYTARMGRAAAIGGGFPVLNDDIVASGGTDGKPPQKQSVDAAVAAFDEAAAASGLERAPPLRACTLLERLPVVVRELEDWEAEFVEFSEARQEALAREYPAEFWERMEGGANKTATGGGGGGDGAAAADGAAGTDHSGEGMEMFYEAMEDEDDDEDGAFFDTPEPRITAADKINNTKSLDRALDQRLVFLAQRKSDGRWVFPGEIWEGPEAGPLRGAAETALSAAFGPKLDVWYPGNAPMGYWLRQYDAETAARQRCFGEKVFFYRAQLIGGFISLGDDYSDYRWLTHAEAGEYLHNYGMGADSTAEGHGEGDAFYKYMRMVL